MSDRILKKDYRYKLVIFDLDGTLLDTLPDLAGAVNYALRTHEKPERTIDDIRRFISNGVRKLIARALFITSSSRDTDDYVIEDEVLYESVFADFVSYYIEHAADNSRPYAGMAELLKELKAAGVKSAVVTNKREDAAIRLMDIFYPDCFCKVFGDGNGRERKPSPDSVLKLLKETNTDPRDAVYVGDSDVDLQTANNAGVDHILVTWGYRSIGSLIDAGAKVTIDTPDELAMML